MVGIWSVPFRGDADGARVVVRGSGDGGQHHRRDADGHERHSSTDREPYVSQRRVDKMVTLVMTIPAHNSGGGVFTSQPRL